MQWIARHIPLSVSLASNVPGHETPHCYVTDGDSDKLVGSMMSDLSAISDAAFDMLMPSYDNVLNELEVRKDAWDEAERKAPREDDSKLDDEEAVEMEESKTNPYKTLIGQLLGWLHQLPVIGFNSGRYDLNVIKQFFVPYLLKPSKQDNEDVEEEEEDDDDDETRFVIKRQNTFMCFATKKLTFLEITSYLAPGFSYDKYLKAYGCELHKGNFPYEYMYGIGKLEDRDQEPDVKSFLAPASRPRWTMTQQQILAAVVDGTLFGMVECDVRFPDELQDYFFRNAACVQEHERYSR